MINYTERLDKAIRKAAWAHEKQYQHRKGSDIPYIIHPFGVMTIASNVTDDENVLIACLMHDILEDVKSSIYNETQMREDFGDKVVQIVKDVTNDAHEKDWYKRSQLYLDHLKNEASPEALIVSASDKIHNLISTLIDHSTLGDDLWELFATKKSSDQLWWYESILSVIRKRNAPIKLVYQLSENIEKLHSRLVD